MAMNIETSGTPLIQGQQARVRHGLGALALKNLM